MLKDKDMGMDCDFVARGNTDEEVMKKMKDHVMTVHKDEIKKMNMSDQELEKMMMPNITEDKGGKGNGMDMDEDM